MVDRIKQTVLVYDMEQDSTSYSFSNVVKVYIYDDLSVIFVG